MGRKLAISRELRNGEFVYVRNQRVITRKPDIQRFQSLSIPPAWSDVEISSSASAKVLARGTDAAGRTQAIYHPSYQRRQARKKFDRMVRFARALPRLRAQVDRDLRRRKMSRLRVAACVVKLLDDQLFRVGNREYTSRHGSYGVTTLQKRHITISSNSAEFDFVGKSGKHQHARVNDPRIARVLEHLAQLPGAELFQYLDEEAKLHELHSGHVNQYLRKYLGAEFSAKDFRTWGATVTATAFLMNCDPEDLQNPNSAAKEARAAVQAVADHLGNTPAVARSSYIDPRILTAFEDPVVVAKVRRKRAKFVPLRHRSVEEQCTLALLRLRH